MGKKNTRIILLGSLNSSSFVEYVRAFMFYKIDFIILNVSREVKAEEFHFGSIEILDFYIANKKYSFLRKKVTKIIKIILARFKIDRSHLFLKARRSVETIESEISYNREIIPFVSSAIKIIGYWSTAVKKEMKICKQINKKIKLILFICTYPVNSYLKFSANEMPIIEEDVPYFNMMNGLIYSSPIMKEYFEKFLFKSNDLLSITFFDSFIKGGSDNKNEREILINDNSPKLIFLGNTDFSERSIDNVKSKLIDLASEGFIVFIQESKKQKKIHENIYTFPPYSRSQISKGELDSFINQFDGVIVLYNSKKDDLRFHLSIPIRLSLALNSLTPIFLPKGNYTAMENLIIKEKIGYCYENPRDLLRYINKNKNKKRVGNEKYDLLKRIEKVINFINVI